MKNRLIACLLISAASLTGCDDLEDIFHEKEGKVLRENPADMPYNVTINPEDFESADITGNLFWPLATGKVFTYEGEDEGGASIKVVTEWTTGTKIIAGVTCMITHDQVYEDDELVEDTYDWYAQDKKGNVWYFGEDTKEIESGKVVSTEGSWQAGMDGALPGVIMFASPVIGVWYRQEYYKGIAEDVGQVLNLNLSVTVPFGQFDNCLQTAEWNLNEPGIVEHKYYAPGVGLIRTVTAKGPDSFEDLAEIE